MNGRWWAPQRATLEPDAVVLALLQPGGDAAGDLGASLLAAHRAGAAACETVAKGAVPSEVGLVKAMATCREHLAGHVVDAVSKSLEPTYAGLLTRDMLDAAEMGALTLFRTAVAKGVAPPMAASRAGAVYGVPFKEMGKYTAAATDPRANPVVLTDLADRTLLGYVSKLVASEVGPVKEAVAKTTHTEWEPDKHPRDPVTGEFTHKTGTAGELPPGPPRRGAPVLEAPGEPPTPAVAAPTKPAPSARDEIRSRLGLDRGPEVAPTEAPPTPPPTKPAPAKRRTRTTRQTRKVRSVAQRGALKPTGRAAKPARQVMSVREAARITEATTAKMAVANRKSVLAQAEEPEGLASGSDQTLLRKPFSYVDPTQYHPLAERIGVYLQQSEANNLIAQMATGQDYAGKQVLLFRMGHLLSAAGGPQAAEVTSTRAYADKFDHEADLALNDELISGRTGPIDVYEVDYGTSPRDILAERERLAGVAEMTGERGEQYEGVDLGEFEHTGFFPLYRSYIDEDAIDEEGNHYSAHSTAIIHARPGDAEHPEDRPIPTVTEFVIKGDARGYTDGTGENVQYFLDPNQAYRLGGMIEYFDADKKVKVQRYEVIPLIEEEVVDFVGEENVDKALEGAQAREFEQEHPRDEHGRFVQAMERTSAPAPTAPTKPTESVRDQIRARLLGEKEQVSTPAVEATPVTPARPARRRTRAVRQTRKVRAVRAPAPAKAERTATKDRQAYVGGGIERTMTLLGRSVERKERNIVGLPDIPPLADRTHYIVMDAAQYNEFLDHLPHVQDVGLFAQRSIPVEGQAWHLLVHKELMGADEAIELMNSHVEDDYLDKEGFEYGMPLFTHRIRPGHEDEDRQRLDARIRDAENRNPELRRIELVEASDHSGLIHAYGNRQPLSDLYLIELDADIDIHQPFELKPLGLFRTREILPPGYRPPEGTDKRYSAQFRRYKVVQRLRGQSRVTPEEGGP